MKRLTREWVEKAEADFISAQREARARKHPNFDDACFHAQQCAEKYLKARLQEAEIGFSKTHNLIALLDLSLSAEPKWEALRPSLRALNVFAVDFRYPGESATKEMAKASIGACRKIRLEARLSLGLSAP
jgi:HEPN domain-containing protein